MKIAILLVLLAASARANLIVNSISGNQNSLHADFSLDWINGTTQATGGVWEGGAWQFLSLNGPLDTTHDEGIMQFYLRNIWADNWNPGPVWYLQWISSQPYTSPDHQFLLSNINLDTPVTYDYAATGLQYHMNASLFGNYQITPTGGAAHLIFDLDRTAPPTTQDVNGTVVNIQQVPETGSTLLFALVAMLFLSGCQTPFRPPLGGARPECNRLHWSVDAEGKPSS